MRVVWRRLIPIRASFTVLGDKVWVRTGRAGWSWPFKVLRERATIDRIPPNGLTDVSG